MRTKYYIHWWRICLGRRLHRVVVLGLSCSLQVMELVGYLLGNLQLFHVFLENFFPELDLLLILRA